MVCIYCGGATAVTNSRKTVRLFATWRRRRCKDCGAQFTSNESIDMAQSLVVRSKQTKDLEPFSRDTLYISIYESCRHRPTAAADATALTQTILAAILRRLPAHTERGVVPTSEIRTQALTVLQRFDTVAATYYQAYYRA